MQLKTEALLAQQREFEKQQAEIARIEEYVRRYKAGIKSRQARGRATRLAKMERMEAPYFYQGLTGFSLAPERESSERVLEINNLAKGFGTKKLFSGFNFLLRRGECVGILGNNGTGKSTLLKIILKQLAPDTGELKYGANLQIGYFAQEHEDLHLEYTVLEEIRNNFAISEEAARNLLGYFLFKGDDVFKRVKDLSGGERGRLVLAKLFLTRPNFLLLDEPTNHLDIEAKEALEAALVDFPGTILLISHDRYFLDRLVDRIIELDGGRFQEYHGNYTYYREKKQEQQQRNEPAKTVQAVKEQKQAKKSRLPKAKKPTLAEIEQTITALETEMAELAVQLGDQEVCSNGEAVVELTAQYQAAEQKLAEYYELWEAVVSEESV